MKNQEILDRVIEAQKGFVYEKKVDVDGYQIWHCHKPGTRAYSFEIAITREGVCVKGDIDTISWSRRTGLDFLAGRDVDYYIYSKLDGIYQDKVEVDEEAVDRFLAEEMVRWLWDEWDTINKIEEIPWKEYDIVPLDDLVAFYEDQNIDQLWECSAWELYRETRDLDTTDVHRAYEIFYSNTEDPDAYITVPEWGVMFSMYMACYAARKIKEMEDGSV